MWMRPAPPAPSPACVAQPRLAHLWNHAAQASARWHSCCLLMLDAHYRRRQALHDSCTAPIAKASSASMLDDVAGSTLKIPLVCAVRSGDRYAVDALLGARPALHLMPAVCSQVSRGRQGAHFVMALRPAQRSAAITCAASALVPPLPAAPCADLQITVSCITISTAPPPSLAKKSHASEARRPCGQ